MAVQSIHNLWAAAQHLFWLIYKEAWTHAGEQEKNRGSDMYGTKNQQWTACSTLAHLDDRLPIFRHSKSTAGQQRNASYFIWVRPLTEATKPRLSHDCTTTPHTLSNCPLSETKFLFHLFNGGDKKKKKKKLPYQQPQYVTLSMIWEYLLTGCFSDGRREQSLMRNKSGTVRVTRWNCQDHESLVLLSSIQMTAQSKSVNRRAWRWRRQARSVFICLSHIG